MLARRCHAAAYIGHVPWTLVHDPMADRRIALSELVTRLELNQYPVKLIDRVDLTFVQEPSERLAALGRFLQEVGGLEAPELAEPG